VGTENAVKIIQPQLFPNFGDFCNSLSLFIFLCFGGFCSNFWRLWKGKER